LRNRFYVEEEDAVEVHNGVLAARCALHAARLRRVNNFRCFLSVPGIIQARREGCSV
jgi:hypothetical protein